MTIQKNFPITLLAVGLFAMTGLAPANPAAANPVAHLVDCSDSFWIVACTTDGDPEAATPDTDVVIGEPVQIDNDFVCVEIEGGFIACHT